MKKTVKIKDTSSNDLKSYTTTATTYGELQKELNLNFNGKKVIVRETRHTLESAEAKLPDGDFILFVMPVKTKAGLDYDSMDYHSLRRLSKERGLPANGVSSGLMRVALREQDNYEVPVENSSLVENDEQAEISSIVNAALDQMGSVREHLELIRTKILNLKLGTAEPTIDYLDEILAEYDALKNELGL